MVNFSNGEVHTIVVCERSTLSRGGRSATSGGKRGGVAGEHE